MARFCSNCGAPLNDKDRFCGKCGTQVTDTNTAENEDIFEEQPVVWITVNNRAGSIKDSVMEALGGVSKKMYTVVAICIAVIVLLIVGIKVFGSGSGYKGAINKVSNSFLNENPEAIVKMTSRVGIELSGVDEDDLLDMYDEEIDDYLDFVEEKVDGNVRKVETEFKKDVKLPDRKLDKLKDTLEEQYDIDASGIKDIRVVTVNLIWKGEHKSDTFKDKNVKFYLVKEKGGWKIATDELISLCDYDFN